MLAAGVFLVAVGAGCGDDDGEASAEEKQEVEDIAVRVVGADASDAEFFFAHITDNIIETVLFAPSRDECEANAAECIGDPLTVESASGTAIDGDTATTRLATDFGTYDVGLVLEDGEWTVDTFGAASDEVPEGAALVDLGLSEFNFLFDEEEIPADGNVAFHVTNFGVQGHEVVVIGVPEGADLEEALEAVFTEEAPPLAFKVFIQPGQEVDMALEEPLAPGNYALVCFLPDTSDPEFAPHFEKGMVAEFSVE